MSVKITYFVHGTTIDNEKDVATGWDEGELSEAGVKQSQELGALTVNKIFHAVFCSDLKRAIESAHLAFAGKYQIIIDERLREANYGDFTGRSSDLFKSKLYLYVDQTFPNGESYKAVEKRMLDFLNFLSNNYKGKHVAIVAHQAPQLALEVLLNKKTWQQAIKEDWRIKKAWQPGWEYNLQ